MSNERFPYVAANVVSPNRPSTSSVVQPGISVGSKSATLPARLDQSASSAYPQIRMRMNANTNLVTPGFLFSISIVDNFLFLFFYAI